MVYESLFNQIDIEMKTIEDNINKLQETLKQMSEDNTNEKISEQVKKLSSEVSNMKNDIKLVVNKDEVKQF